jgi:sporulation protein YlmC with PRC-barrel domain
MTKFRHATALIALLAASGIAYAQDSTAPAPQPAPSAQPADCPAPGSVPEAEIPEKCKSPAGQTGTDVTKTNPDGTTAQPPAASTDTTTQPPAASTDTTTTPSTDTATGQMPADMDMKSAFLASNFIGQTVYSAANENIGEINDLVMTKEKGAVVAIIGVGGFLGIGEKDVAIPIEQVSVAREQNSNNLRLTVNATREQLEAAPAFDRTALYVAPGSTTGTTGTTNQ